MQGNVGVNNVTGLSLVNHKDDISFMIDCMNPCTDGIVIPKGLRMNHQPSELIIQKPGEADGGPNKIVIPYGIDLHNLAYRLSTLENESGSGSGEGVNPEYLIDKITATNSYVGVDQCYNLFEIHEPFSIPYGMNNKFLFKYTITTS
jgi:hypothetical protein